METTNQEKIKKIKIVYSIASAYSIIYLLMFAIHSNFNHIPEWTNLERGVYFILSVIGSWIIYLSSKKELINITLISVITMLVIYLFTAFITWGDTLDITKWNSEPRTLFIVFPIVLAILMEIIKNYDSEDDYYY